jgi:hypothetical protein
MWRFAVPILEVAWLIAAALMLFWLLGIPLWLVWNALASTFNLSGITFEQACWLSLVLSIFFDFTKKRKDS